MPNGDTSLQYPFPYKNAGNDVTVSPNSTFNVFDTIDLIVQNNATIGGILSTVNISSSGIIDALLANFTKNFNGRSITSISNNDLGPLATAEINFFNNLNSGRIGIGGINSSFPNRFFIDTSLSGTTGITTKISASQNYIIETSLGNAIVVGTSGININQSLFLPNLTANTLLGLNGAKEIISVPSTGSGSIVLNNSPTFTGTAQFASLTASTAIGVSSGGTGLSALGTALQQLRVNAGGTALEYFTSNISSLTGGLNISVTGSPNATVALSGTVGTSNGGTGLSTVGTSGQVLTSNGTSLVYQTPTTYVSSVAATVPSFLSIAGSPITSSGTLAFGLSGTALPVTSGGTGLISLGPPTYLLRVNPAGTSLEYVPDPSPIASITVGVPSFMTITGSPLTSSGTLTFGLSGTALPVTSGGTGTTTSTGTGSVVLSSSPTLTTPSLGAAAAQSLSVLVLGSIDTESVSIYQAALGSTNKTSIRLGISQSNSAIITFKNNLSVDPTFDIGFDNAVAPCLRLTKSGILAAIQPTGGFAGNTIALPAPGTIGEIYGDPLPTGTGFGYGYVTTIPILTTVTILGTQSFSPGVYTYNIDGTFQVNNSNAVLTINVTLGGTSIGGTIQAVVGINKTTSAHISGLFRVTTTSDLVYTGQLSIGTSSNVNFKLHAVRTG